MTKENTPTTGAGALEAEGASPASDSTAPVSECDLETALLRGLLAVPAAVVVDVLTRVERDDLVDEHRRAIFDAVARRSRGAVDAGEKDKPVDAVAVQVDLGESGALAHGVTDRNLLAAVTGPPPSNFDLETLADGCRMARLRRAMNTAGRALVGASVGSVDEMRVALRNAGWLPVLAERAGIRVGRSRRAAGAPGRHVREVA